MVACYNRALREGNARVTGEHGAAAFVEAVTAMSGLSEEAALRSVGATSNDAVQAAVSVCFILT